MLDLRDRCLTAGVREAEYWDMTVGEAVRAINAYNERRKERAYFDYSNALTIGLVVRSLFSSNPPPKISDIYPELYPAEDIKEAEEKRQEASSVAFINFANAFNRKFDNGSDRRTESENNG